MLFRSGTMRRRVVALTIVLADVPVNQQSDDNGNDRGGKGNYGSNDRKDRFVIDRSENQADSQSQHNGQESNSCSCIGVRAAAGTAGVGRRTIHENTSFLKVDESYVRLYAFIISQIRQKVKVKEF